MTFSKFHPIFLGLMAGTALFFASCDKDNDDLSGSEGRLNMEITDGPSDDPNVKAVFVTIAEVKVDGQTFSGFSKKTINIMAYQQGNVAALGLGNLEAGTYQNITLVLDAEKDADGNAPGSYVQTKDNVKHALSSTASHSVTASQEFVITAGATTDVVLDFDLRKAIQYQSGSASDQYDFVSTADLQAALRLVIKSEAGTISGSVQNSIVNTEKIVAYAYKKGTFNRNVEIQASNGVAFKNAVGSATVDSNGDFKLAFMDNANYEIHFAAYKDVNSDGKLDLQGTLIVDSLIGLLNLELGIHASIDLDITVIGILP